MNFLLNKKDKIHIYHFYNNFYYMQFYILYYYIVIFHYLKFGKENLNAYHMFHIMNKVMLLLNYLCLLYMFVFLFFLLCINLCNNKKVCLNFHIMVISILNHEINLMIFEFLILEFLKLLDFTSEEIRYLLDLSKDFKSLKIIV